jgi:hypothetical protein
MPDPAKWEALLKAEWSAISSAPYSFVAALIVGWIIGWIVIRAWYRRSIEIEKSATKLAEAERDIERRAKEGLREALLELEPDARVKAIEIGGGDPEVREVVTALAAGKNITTPIDPSARQAHLTFPLSDQDVKTTAAVAYTSANGLSQVIRTEVTGTTVSTGTPVTVNVVQLLGRLKL